MQSSKTSKTDLVLLMPSGIGHPYCGVESTLLQENMLARITCWPPLGEETVVPYTDDHKKCEFHVLFETASDPQNDSIDKWEVQLWHNLHDQNRWEELELLPADESSNIFNVSSNDDCQKSTTRTHQLTVKLQGRPTDDRPLSFTVRFRRGGDAGWKWVRDLSGTEDGQIFFQKYLPPHNVTWPNSEFAEYIDGISPDLTVRSEVSQTSNTLLWSVQGNVEAARGPKSGASSWRLGYPSKFTRWFATTRGLSCWLVPEHGKNRPLAKRDAVLYSFKRFDGQHVVLLAVSGIEDILTVLQYRNHDLVISATNDRGQTGKSHVLVAVGYSYDTAAAAAMYHARALVSDPALIKEQQLHVQNLAQVEQQRKEEDEKYRVNWVQDWYDGFTYCTWNGLGQKLTEEKIKSALRSLADNGIPITNLIIDDNWQSLDSESAPQMTRAWTEFEANKEGFPDGLKAAIMSIRSSYPTIIHIGVWHALLGYWGGVSAHGKIAKDYRVVKVKKKGGFFGDESYFVDAVDAARMYDDFYSFLRDSGIDSVKTDVQCMLDEIEEAPDRREFISTYLNTWTTAQLKHFYGHAISCMSQEPANIFQAQLPNDIPRLAVRNSDDFFPLIEESHPWHIFCNAHNALFTQYLNVLPDWDMFQTNHKWGAFHAAARCVSGGPIYVTDEPGKHNVALIKQMTAQTIRGQTVILRPSVVGRSRHVYIGFEERRLCIVGAYDGRAGTGSSFLGAFNCRAEPIEELVSFETFMGVETDVPYVVRSFRSGRVGPVMHAKSTDLLDHSSKSLMRIKMQGHGSDILSATPVYTEDLSSSTSYSPSDHSQVSISSLGLIDKLAGAAAVLNVLVSQKNPTSMSATSPTAISTSTEPGNTENAGLTNWEAHLSAAQRARRKRVRVYTNLKALGLFGLWIAQLPEMDLEEDFMVLIEGQPVPLHTVCINHEDRHVLEIDTAAAWAEMELKPGWSNELRVQVFMFFS